MKKKIAHMLILPIMAGSQQISFDILKNLDSNKYEKYIIVGHSDNKSSLEFYEAFRAAGVEIIIVDELKRSIGIHDVFVIKKLMQIMQEYKFDIVHTHSTKSAIVGRLAARFVGIKKIVHTVHGISFHKEEPILKRTIYYMAEFFSSFFGDFNIVVNKCYLKYYWYLPKDRCFNIYNGVDFSKLNCIKKKNNEVLKTCRILFMGRLDRSKDPITFLKAINVLAKDNLKIEAWIGGIGELEQECIAFVNENNLNDNVKFLGWVTDKSSIYNSCDILCVPSIFEAFGLVFVEAGYFNLPVVSTTVGGIPEVVKDTVTGYLIPPKDYIQLASKLSDLSNDIQKRIRFGRNAYEYVTKEFDINKMVLAYDRIYNLS
ncbi:MAG: glycosyltransferase involved in cell wall biosynthesis [Cognaticolwellia sp.]|jgi:glycosyltransferase involved in cell wall biosynthesis